jgi:integrase/recombinase XerC
MSPATVRSSTVVRLGHRRAAPSTINRRTAAVWARLEHRLMLGALQTNPVPAPRRGQWAASQGAGGCWAVLARGVRAGAGSCSRTALPCRGPRPRGRGCVSDRSAHPSRPGDAAGRASCRRGPQAAANGCRLRSPIDCRPLSARVNSNGSFRSTGSSSSSSAPIWAPSAPPGSGPMTEAEMRSLFRHHRQNSGAFRVRLHRLRYTYGTELAAAGIDLLVACELMDHASPETTAGGVHTCPRSIWPPSLPPLGR